MDGVGVPVYFGGAACVPGSAYVLGNDFVNGTFPIWLDQGANIGHIAFPVGPTYFSSDNKYGSFTSTCYSKTTSGANPGLFEIKNRGTGTYEPDPLSLGLPPSCFLGAFQMLENSTSPSFNPPLDGPCNPPAFLMPGPQNNISEIAALLNNTFNFSVSDAEFKFNGRKKMMHLLRHGVINPQADTSFSAFMISNSNTNMGKFVDIDSLMESGVENNFVSDIATAYSVNSLIVAGNGMEQIQKDVNDLYLNYLQNGTLDLAQLTQLRAIAQLCPFTDGASIYQARSLLVPFDSVQYWNSCELGVNLSSQKVAFVDENVEKDKNITIYPNPSNNQLFVVVRESSSENLIFSLFDALGKRVIDKKINVSNGVSEIELNEVTGGVYFYRVQSGNLTLKEDKIIILK